MGDRASAMSNNRTVMVRGREVSFRRKEVEQGKGVTATDGDSTLALGSSAGARQSEGRVSG